MDLLLICDSIIFLWSQYNAYTDQCFQLAQHTTCQKLSYRINPEWQGIYQTSAAGIHND